MSRTVRTSLLFLLTTLVVATLALSVLAQGDGGEDTDDGTEVTSTTVSSGLTPAVEIETEAVEAPAVDWTYRYLIPTGLALAGIIIVLTAVKYFTDVVRKRYRIVE